MAAANLDAPRRTCRTWLTLYFARSNLLQNAWEGNNMGQIFQLLDQQRPGSGERDFRDFEWHYRDRMCHQDLLTIATLGGDRPDADRAGLQPGRQIRRRRRSPSWLKAKPSSFGEFAIDSLADGSLGSARVKIDFTFTVLTAMTR